MAPKSPTKSEILDLVQAQSETAQDVSERLVRIEKLVDKQEDRNDKQESKNQNTLYAVLFAFILIVITVAVEVILSNRNDSSEYDGMHGEINNLESKLQETKDQNTSLQNQIDLLRAKNSYLK